MRTTGSPEISLPGVHLMLVCPWGQRAWRASQSIRNALSHTLPLPDVGGYRTQVAEMTAKAQELGVTAASMAGEAATAVGETMGSLASVIRDNAPHEGTIASAATTVAGGLESASSYLQEKGYENIATDLTAVIRRYPVQSLLVGVGLGYVLARMTKE